MSLAGKPVFIWSLRIAWAALVIGFTILVFGCSTPQWRIFQAKVPDPIVKEEKQVEAERSAADLIARTITEPKQMVPVAQKLSESLGAPQKQIDATDLNKARDEAIQLLIKGLRMQQDQLNDLNSRLAKYEGKEIEGTGFNVFGFAVSLPVLGVIALAIFCPSSIGVMWWLLKKAKAAGDLATGALKATIAGVQTFKADNPEASKAINTALDGAQDYAHKLLVKEIKLTT